MEVTFKIEMSSEQLKNAALSNDLDTLKSLLKNGNNFDQKVLDTEFFFELTKKNVSVELLQFIKELGCDWDERAYVGAFHDNREPMIMLEWLHKNGCPFDETLCASAAYDLHYLQWAREIGAPWDVETLITAAIYHATDVLKWARESDCPWNEKLIEKAVDSYAWHSVRWLLDNNYPWITPEIKKELLDYEKDPDGWVIRKSL